MRISLLLLSACSPMVVDFKDPAAPGGDTAGLDDAPDITLDTEALDLGVTLAGADTNGTFTFRNDGSAALTGGIALSGEGFRLDTTAFSLDPGVIQVVTVGFSAFPVGVYTGTSSITSNDPDEGEVVVSLTAEVGEDRDGDGFVGSDDCDDDDATVNPDATEIWYDGIDQDCSGTSDYDQDGDGDDASAYGGGDCDDLDAEVGPSNDEIWYDGFDQDCDGRSDYDRDADGYDATSFGGEDCDDTAADIHPGTIEDTTNNLDDDCDGAIDETLSTVDDDGDGWTEATGDCLEGDASVHPGAEETWYDGVDSNCDGANDYDQDADGHDAAEHGGGDCDDVDATVNPDAVEVWYDGVDQDCSGGSDDDQDGDGYDLAAECDDTDASVNPGVPETWYDGVDQDCSGGSDYDADLDGFDAESGGGADCNDLDATANPAGTEVWYDDVDQDCDGNDDDQDGDGYDALASGGDDCDDLDATANPGGTEVWYDDVDQDCDGNDDDQDGDGYEVALSGGDDCDDLDAAINPAATELWYDDVDQDCDGNDDDQDGDGHDVAVSGGDDCDDTDAAIYTGAVEVWYDGVDQDCDGNDADQDRDGTDALAMGGTDCDDTAAGVYVGAAEVCDGVDQDCDGTVDEGVTTTYYADADVDGYGDASATIAACSLPSGYVTNATDCDDGDNSANPGSAELAYDHADNDCDTITDEALAEDESSWTVLGEMASDAIGTGGVHAWEDCDGDGDPELVIATPHTDSVFLFWTTYDFGTVSFHDVDTAGIGVDANSGYLTAWGISQEDGLGSSVALLGDVDADGDAEIAFGSANYDNGDEGDGLAWAFDVDGRYGTLWPEYVYEGVAYSSDGGEFGSSTASGDLDGDGLAELVIGAPGESSAKGRVYVAFHGDNYWGGVLDGSDVSYYLRGDGNDDQLGTAVAVGDLNSDGRDDLVACAPGDDDGGSAAGRCFLIVGTAAMASAGVHGSSVSSYDTALIQGGAANDGLGLTQHSVDIGDFDGDGAADLAVGVPGYDSRSYVDGGAIYAYTNGSLSGSEYASTATWLATGDGALGAAVRFADLTGDGVAELLGGATTAGAADEGVVYMLLGRTPGGTYTLPDDQDASWSGATNGDLFGAAISEARDLDGDGRDDFAVAATGNDQGASGAGKVYVLPGYP